MASGGALGVIATLAFASLGLPDGVLGVAWPSMRRSFELPVSALGVLLTSGMLGYLASSFATGAVTARIGVGGLLVASSVASAAAALAVALAPTWGVVVAAALLAGAGSGAIDAGVNAFAAARLSARVTSWLHASYGIGATLGPLLTSAVLAREGSWRFAYAVVAAALLGMGAAFARTAGQWTAGVARAAPRRPALRDTLRERAVRHGAALFFVYAGLEVGAGQWAHSWLVDGRGVAPAEAGVWVAAFWGSLTAGRVALGALTSRVGIGTLLRGAMAAAPAGVLVLWAGLGPARGAAGLVVLGLALAPIFPLLIADTPRRVGSAHAAQAIGFQIAAFCLGAAVLPGAAGVLARGAGLDALGPFLLGTALALASVHGLADRPASAPAASGATAWRG